MTDIQKKLLVLLDEIKGVCDEKHLTWFLAGQTAQSAVSHQGFLNKEYLIILCMPVSDIRILMDELSGRKNREFESWINSPDMSEFAFRYVNSSSLLIDLETKEFHSALGVAIEILPLLPSDISEGTKRDIAHAYHEINRVPVVGKKYTRTYWRRWKAARKNSAYFIFRNRASLEKNALNELLSYSGDVQNETVLYKDGKWHNINKDALYNTVHTEVFEGRECPVSDKLKFKPKNKNNRILLPKSERLKVIRNVGLPYREYLETIDGGIDRIRSVKKDWYEYQQWLEKVEIPRKGLKGKYISQVLYSRDRLDCWYWLRDKKDQLLADYQSDNIEACEEILTKYLEFTDTYYKKDLGFYIDDDIFKCARAIWKKNGRKDTFADSVYALVPDLYKKETPDEYIDRRRAEGKMK